MGTNCEIIFNLDQQFRGKCCLKDVSYLELWASGSHFVQRSETLCAIILNLGQWFRCCKYFLSTALVPAILFGGAEEIMQFWKDIMENIHVKLFEIWRYPLKNKRALGPSPEKACLGIGKHSSSQSLAMNFDRSAVSIRLNMGYVDKINRKYNFNK